VVQLVSSLVAQEAASVDNALVEVDMHLVGLEEDIAQEDQVEDTVLGDQVEDTVLGDQEADIDPGVATLNL
jgi:hypothetical protein